MRFDFFFSPTHFLWADYYAFANDSDKNGAPILSTVLFHCKTILGVANVTPKRWNSLKQ